MNLAASALYDLLPHRPPMLMVSRIVKHDQQQIHCDCEIAYDNPLLHDGRFPTYGGLELLAQASGLHLGLTKPRPNGIEAGAIVQVKAFELRSANIAPGAHVDIQSRFVGGSQEAALYEGVVTYAGKAFFLGSIMIVALSGKTHDP